MKQQDSSVQSISHNTDNITENANIIGVEN